MGMRLFALRLFLLILDVALIAAVGWVARTTMPYTDRSLWVEIPVVCIELFIEVTLFNIGLGIGRAIIVAAALRVDTYFQTH